MSKRLSWTIKVSVNKSWVADGFNPDADRFKEAIVRVAIPGAYNHEVGVRILEDADQKEVARLQGFKSKLAMEKASDKRKRVSS